MVWSSVEFLFHSTSYGEESCNFPPFWVQDNGLLFWLLHELEFLNDSLSIGASGDPDLFLVLLEIILFSALTLEVEVEPLEEFTSHDEQVSEVVKIQRCENDEGQFVCGEADFIRKL